MPLVFPSALSVSRFDGRNLLVIMIIVAVTLTVESQISNIADFIPEQLASNQGHILPTAFQNNYSRGTSAVVT